MTILYDDAVIVLCLYQQDLLIKQHRLFAYQQSRLMEFTLFVSF